MTTAIKQLCIDPNGGTFTLGSGDASLVVPPGAVEKVTTIRYAIILHGPFIFPPGYMPVSVVVYINMDGAILMKPVQLCLSHWCNREEENDEEDLKFAKAPHTLGEGQEYYEFQDSEQEEADFITHTNMGILKISKPQCVHCVKGKPGMIARYRAMTFTRVNPPPEDTQLFRIQIMCDSLEWNEVLNESHVFV